jgi:hypothetical protein
MSPAGDEGVWAVWASNSIEALRKVGWGKGFDDVDAEELSLSGLFDRLDEEAGGKQLWDEIQGWMDRWYTRVRLR